MEYVKTVFLNRLRKHARVSGFILCSRHEAKKTSAASRNEESTFNDLEMIIDELRTSLMDKIGKSVLTMTRSTLRAILRKHGIRVMIQAQINVRSSHRTRESRAVRANQPSSPKTFFSPINDLKLAMVDRHLVVTRTPSDGIEFGLTHSLGA